MCPDEIRFELPPQMIERPALRMNANRAFRIASFINMLDTILGLN